jgi:uncharacterized DUF497 family protein
MKFDWDVQKAAINVAKHGISFEQAITVFDDPVYLDIYDVAHSTTEHRWIRVGLSDSGVLVVVYTMRKSRIYRIISARPANHKERRLYNETQGKD